MNKYELIKILGDGTYGIVYEGRNRETREKVAVKKLKEKFSSLEECLRRKEVRILEQLNHENIVQLKEVIREKTGETSYIFEYCDCNLFDFIDKHRKYQKLIPEPIIRNIALQITKGIKYMHSNQYFHRDLKPENILVKLNDYDFNNINNNSQLKIKIADFGTAKEIPLRSNMPMTDYVCTRWYRAPECVLRTDFYDEKIDIWAIGCIMAELYILGPIFPGENEFDQLHQILKILGTPTRGKWPWGYFQTELLGLQLPIYYKKDFKKILKYISKEGVNLLNEILQFEPSMRPSCSKILNHPYFKMIEKIPISPYQNNLRNISRRNMILNNSGETDRSKNSIPYYNRSNKSLINEIKNNINNVANNRKNKINQGLDKPNKNNFINKIDIESDNKIKNNIIINSSRKKNNRSLYISNKNINNLNLNNDRIEINANINMRNTISSNININGQNTIGRNISNIGNKYINYIGNANHKSNINNFRKTITDKTLKKNKYEKTNETRVGIERKKIVLRFNKNIREESKDNETDYYRKELKSNRIGSFKSNTKRKYSYISVDKEENKEDSKNKTIENYQNKRYIHFSSDKSKIPKRIMENKKRKEFKKYTNFENDYCNLSCDGNIYNTNSNYYDKYNSYRKNNDKKIIHFHKKTDKIDENNKDKYNIIYRSNHKNVNKDNHTFYESKAGKMSYRKNNENYKSHNNNYYNYNSCKCSLLRNYSSKRNVMIKDEGNYISNTHNIRSLGDYYMNNSTPRAQSNKRKNYNNTLSPIKNNEQNNSLFNSFLISNNNNLSSGKSQSLIKKRKITSYNNSKNTNDNKGRNQIKVVNINENQNNHFANIINHWCTGLCPRFRPRTDSLA